MPAISIKRPYRKLVKRVSNRLTGKGIINFRNQGSVNYIDVGSSGHMPEPWLSNACHIRNLLSFEPQENKKKRKNVIISSNALWSSCTRKPFYIYKGLKSSGSSLFEQNFEYVSNNFESLKLTGPRHLAETWHERSALVKVTGLDCKTLDQTLKDLDLPYKFDFLKIDAQGAEFEILLGAEDFLKDSCLGLQLELFTIPLYKGIKLMPDVIALLDLKGFSLVRKFPPHGSFNSQNDCVFLKRDFPPEKEKILLLLRKIYDL